MPKKITKRIANNEVNYQSKGYRGWENDIADALETTEQIKNASRWLGMEERKMIPTLDKITWVLTAVNVVILISLVIRNV